MAGRQNYLVYFLTKTVSPHSVNVIVRCCSTPRFFDVFVSALKILGSMIDERKHTTCPFACSTFRFYAACIQTCRCKTAITDKGNFKLFLMQSRTCTNLLHPIQWKCQSKVSDSCCPIRNCTRSLLVAMGTWCCLVTSTEKIADPVTFQGFCRATEPGTVYRRYSSSIRDQKY